MAKTKTKPKSKTKTPSLLAQAQSEKDVQYAPQIATAQSLLGDAGEQLKSDIETAKNNSAAVKAYAEDQKAPTIERYKGAQGAVQGFQANTDAAMRDVGPAGDIFHNAVASEQGSLRSRLTGAGTRASQELVDRQTAAEAGRVGAESQARQDYRKTKKSLTDQIQTLVGQKQADVMARFGQLVEAEANRQNDIDVAKIGADARRDVAAAGATNRANSQAAKDKEKEQKRVGDIRKSTGELKRNVTNIISRWNELASASAPKPNPRFDSKSPISDTNKPYLNADGNPVEEPGNAAQIKPTPAAIRAKIRDEYKDVDGVEGLIHVALTLRGPNKALDQAAIKYIQDNPNWRVPREWLRKSMTPKHIPDRYGAAGRGADTT